MHRRRFCPRRAILKDTYEAVYPFNKFLSEKRNRVGAYIKQTYHSA
jgi:hypothetical protein